MAEALGVGIGLLGEAETEFAIKAGLECYDRLVDGEGACLGGDGGLEIGPIGLDDAAVIPGDGAIWTELGGVDDVREGLAGTTKRVEVVAHLEFRVGGIWVEPKSGLRVFEGENVLVEAAEGL